MSTQPDCVLISGFDAAHYKYTSTQPDYVLISGSDAAHYKLNSVQYTGTRPDCVLISGSDAHITNIIVYNTRVLSRAVI